MTEEIDDAMGLLDELRVRSQRYGNVPKDVTNAALGAFAFRNFESELATLLRDSAHEATLAGARSTASDVRILEFEIPGGRLNLGFTDRSLTGTVIDRGDHEVVIQSRHERVSIPVDDYGDFICSPLPVGPIRIEIGDSSNRVVTDWLLP